MIFLTRIFYYFFYYFNHFFYSIEKKIIFYDSEEDEKIDTITSIEDLTKQDPEKVNKTLEIKDFVPLQETEKTEFIEENDDELPYLISEEISYLVSEEISGKKKECEEISFKKEEDTNVLHKQESKDSIVLEKKESVKSEHIIDKKLPKKWWICF